MNRLDDGMHSPEYVGLLKALVNAPPGRVAETAKAILASKPVILPLFRETAELAVQAEIEICAEQRNLRQRRKPKKEFFFYYDRTRNVIENKRRKNWNLPRTLHHTENTRLIPEHAMRDISPLKTVGYKENLDRQVCIRRQKSGFFDPICGTRVEFSSHLNQFQAHNEESEFPMCPIDHRPSSIGDSRVPCPVSRFCVLTLGGSGN